MQFIYFRSPIAIIGYKALKYFYPEREYSWDELDKLTGKRDGLWTWPTYTMLNLDKLGIEVKTKANFDYSRFIDQPADTLYLSIRLIKLMYICKIPVYRQIQKQRFRLRTSPRLGSIQI